MQAERIWRQKIGGDRRVALQGRRITITVDKVLQARGKMLRNKANAPADCLVTEMLQFLPTETEYEVAHRFDKWFRRECRAPEPWTILRLVFLKKPDAQLEKGLRGFRAIALMSVFPKRYVTVLVDLLHQEKEKVEWRRLHVGAERGVNCEHMLRRTIRHRLKQGDTWVGYRKRTARSLRISWKKMGPAGADRKDCEQNLDYYDPGCLRR